MAVPQLREYPVLPWGQRWRDVRDLYVTAFPPEERISLNFLVASSILRPSCRFSAWYASDRFAGLTYIVRRGDLTLFLFLAVSPSARSVGVGSRLLELVGQPRGGGATVLQLEPLDATADNAEQRSRRWDFYVRNGFRPSPLVSIEAGETYATMIRGREVGREEFQRLLRGFILGTRSVSVP